MTRSNRRPLVVYGLAVTGALTIALVSACGAGQIAQTAAIQPAVPGANVQAPGRPVFVRQATVEYGGPKGYPKGASAPVSFWVFNDTREPISLVNVSAAEVLPDGRTVPVQLRPATGAGTAAPCATPRSPGTTPLPTTTASASPSGSASASGSVSTSPSASPSPSPSPTGPTSISVTIPATGCVELSPRASQYLQVVDLPEALGNQQAIRAIFQFSMSGGQSFSIGDQKPPADLPVAPPASPLPRPTGSAAE